MRVCETVVRHKRKNGQQTGSVMRRCRRRKINPGSMRSLRRYEEALPRLKEGGLEMASRINKAKTGVRCDGFHPKIVLDLTKETKGEIVIFFWTRWNRVESGRNKPGCSS